MTREQQLMERIQKMVSTLSNDAGLIQSLQDSHDRANATLIGTGGTNSSDKLLRQMEEDPFFLSRCVED